MGPAGEPPSLALRGGKMSSLQELGGCPYGRGWLVGPGTLCAPLSTMFSSALGIPDWRGAGAGRAGWKVLEGRTGLPSCSH